MPGSTPATSQLDWLSSTTAMIVLSWSKATRDLLKSFSWGIGALRQLFASDDGAISFAACPIPSLRWRNGDSNCWSLSGWSRPVSRMHAAPPPQRIYPFPQCRRAPGPGWQADPRRPRQLCHTQTSQSDGLAVAPSALDLPLHPDLGLVAQRGRELLLQNDAATHPSWCVPLDRRPADRHQCVSRRAQCQPQTLPLDQIR